MTCAMIPLYIAKANTMSWLTPAPQDPTTPEQPHSMKVCGIQLHQQKKVNHKMEKKSTTDIICNKLADSSKFCRRSL